MNEGMNGMRMIESQPIISEEVLSLKLNAFLRMVCLDIWNIRVFIYYI